MFEVLSPAIINITRFSDDLARPETTDEFLDRRGVLNYFVLF